MRILLFARAPVAGQVKTRLQERLSTDEVLRLYQSLLKRILRLLTVAPLAPPQLWVAGPWHDTVYEDIGMEPEESEETGDPGELGAVSLPVFRQQGQDLGERMAHGAQCALSGADAIVIIGTDCPALDRDYLDQALSALAAGHDIVIGPAEDGGYVLLGLRRSMPRVFENIPWGSDQVLAVTLERLREAAVEALILPTLWDVDRPADLERLAELQPPLQI